MNIDKVQIGKYWLYVDKDSEPGLKQFQNGINYEPHIRRELERLIPGCKGGFLDVGANAGIHSVSARDIDPLIPVVALEVSPKNVRLLSRTAAENKFDHFQILPVAASDRKGVVGVNQDCDNSACSFDNPEAYPDLWPCYPIGFFNIPEIGVIKVDVEGSEFLVFKGMTHILTQHIRPTVIFEYTPSLVHRCGTTPLEMLSFLTKMGYKLTVLDYVPGIRRTFTDPAEVVTYVDSLGLWVLDIMAHV